jgi:predicted transcriptional regulator
MENHMVNTNKATTRTVEIALEVSDGLEILARDTKRSKSYLAGAAIADYVERNGRQIARIKAALDDATSGTPGISHERMEEWMDSWDTDHELPPPEPQS